LHFRNVLLTYFFIIRKTVRVNKLPHPKQNLEEYPFKVLFIRAYQESAIKQLNRIRWPHRLYIIITFLYQSLLEIYVYLITYLERKIIPVHISRRKFFWLSEGVKVNVEPVYCIIGTGH
jgi:hypothetical protein